MGSSRTVPVVAVVDVVVGVGISSKAEQIEKLRQRLAAQVYV